MKRLLAAALFLVIFLTYHRPARAQTLRVAGDENFPPYEFVDQDNVFKGFNVDLMKAIALFTEMELEFIPMPWEEAYEAIHNGQADIIQGMKVTDARKQRFAFTNTLVQNTDSIYIRAETTGIRSLKDLAGRRVGVDYGDVRNQDLENQGAIVVSYQNPEMALMALYRREVDALVCNTLVINYFSAKHNISSEIAVVGNAFNRRDYAIAVAKGNNELLEQLNAGIKMVRDSGIYDQLYRKWFGVPIVNKTESLRLVLGIVAGALLLLFLITYAFERVNRRLKQVIAEETAKQKAAMDKLREYDKLQFMDKIISSIAHEIRNPLAAIRFYAEQIPYKMDNPRFMAAMAEDIPPEIERIDALIKEFIEYTAPRRPNRESIPLLEALENVLSFLHVQLRDIQVFLNVDRSINVFFDRNHLRQIFINILINSIDALGQTQNPRIEIEASAAASQVKLEISDNGPGMDPQALQYIFDPFFTTKDTGNGLGLFISRQMAEENGGTLTAENRDTGMAVCLTAVRR